MTEARRGGWKKGQSGNPKGRPTGASEVARMRASLADHLPEIINQLVSKAKGGDVQAARILLERVLPPVKAVESTVQIDLPQGASLTASGEAIMQAVATGALAPSQGAALLSGLGSVAKLKEIDELEARIAALEQSKD
ncbi:DUF5681 domain-containing protein [Pseudoduganella danionis]|nr:DUF5681 domain-containing protein [Pseudoduganella danionis]